MRPIKLTMSAFGPYSGVEVVDFEELQGRNLFLVIGPTGSGKTTIFDAISYALYGKASGDMRSEDSLRSHFSDEDQLTEVDLTFELKGIIYHINRSPSQMRPKLRSEGYTEQSPKATLIIEDGDPRTVVTGVSKVNQKVEDIIGINVEQFKQIMMIPQGEFQKLLTSDSQEREKVLQQLFDTYIYKKIQNDLNEQAKSMGSEIKSQKVERDTLVTKIKDADQEELVGLMAADDKHIDRIVELTHDLIKSDETQLKSIEKNIKTYDDQLEATLKAKNMALETNKNINQKEIDSKTLLEQEALAPEMKDQEDKMVMAEKAMRLIGVEDNVSSSALSLEKKKTDLETLILLKDQTSKSLKVAKEAFEKLTSEEAENQRSQQVLTLNNYKNYVEKVEALSKLTGSIKGLEDKLQDNKKAEDLNHQKSTDMSQDFENSKAEAKLLEHSEVALEKSTAAYKEVDQRNLQYKKMVKQLKDLKAEEAKLATLTKEMKDKESAAQAAEKVYKKSKMEFFMNQAALLAKDLKEDQPCPVCGSLDHPNPRSLTMEHMSEKDLEKLDDKVLELNKIHTDASKSQGIQSEKILGMKTTLEDLSSECLGEDQELFLSVAIEQQMNLIDDKLHDNTSSLKSLEDEISRHKSNIAIHKKLLIKMDELQGQIDTSKKNLEVLIEERLKITSELTEDQTTLKIIHKEVPEALRELAVLSGLIKELESALKKDSENLKEVKEAYDTARNTDTATITKHQQLEISIKEDQEALSQLKASFDKKLKEAKFHDYEAYVAAKLSEDDISRIKLNLEAYHKLVDQLKNSIASLEEKTKGLEIVDLEGFDRIQEEVQVGRKTLIDQQGDLRSRVKDNKATIETIQKINYQIKDKEAKYKVIGQLAKVAQGQNPSMMTFERYVLAAFLEDILKAANIRLKQMTQGRYILLRSIEVQHKARQSGLELEVFDNFTGKARHVKTLSGGEGFKASLSMALGLSDVVQSYAGGVRLDTMFIDEGFGTLDQESLDSAINCLIDLQKTGRLVGIISHVQELKERIDTRLEILTSNKGSESRFVLG